MEAALKEAKQPRTKTGQEEIEYRLDCNERAINEIKRILEETKSTVDELKKKIYNGFAEEVARSLLGIKRTGAEKRATIMLELIKIAGTALGSGGIMYLLIKSFIA
jgi:hypothetical protein